jgi:hypothetical protein
MLAIDLIADAVKGTDMAPALPCDPVNAICAVTGTPGPCLPRSEVIGDSFTNQDLLRAPESDYIGVNVYIAWNFGYKSRDDAKRLKCPERMSSWICDGKTFRELSRAEIREIVLQGSPYDVWAGYVTTSYKKHGSLWAKVNHGPYGVWRYEMTDADCRDLKTVHEYWTRMNEALYSGVGRTVIETLEVDHYTIKAAGIKRWLDYEKWAHPLFQSGLYQFIAYLLPSKEERNRDDGRVKTGNEAVSANKQLSLF